MRENRRARHVWGGHPSEPMDTKLLRWHRQTEILRLWPELHEALMAEIGLNPMGAPLSRNTDEHGDHLHLRFVPETPTRARSNTEPEG